MGLIKGLKKSGITSATPKNLLLGAGTIYKNLTWDTSNSTWKGTVLGATSGGNKFSLKPNIVVIDVDGAVVDTKGMTQKQGETASLEINLVEMSVGALKMAMIGEEASSEATGFTKLATKAVIEDSDYLDNIAFVGFLADDTPIVIIMENSLCTSGLELSGKNKEATVIPVTFQPYADNSDDTSQDTLPVFIYYPTKANAEASTGQSTQDQVNAKE